MWKFENEAIGLMEEIQSTYMRHKGNKYLGDKTGREGGMMNKKCRIMNYKF